MANLTTVFIVDAVRTGDPGLPLAEAIAVRKGRVLAVGSRKAVLDAAERLGAFEQIDRPGVTIVPGFQDAHGHLSLLGESLVLPGLGDARSILDVIATLKAAPSSSRQGEWLRARAWDQHRWPERALPGRAELDEAFPFTPVVLTRVDEHAAWVNGEALRRAGISARTPDPEGGRILRDEAGEPTGVLLDNAMSLVLDKLPPVTDAQLVERLEAALARCAEAGITTVHDAGMDLRTFQVLQTWDFADRLPLRVYAMGSVQGEEAEAWLERGPYVGKKLEMRAVKFLLDGALGSRGAALHEPYSDDPANRGLLLWSEASFEAEAEAFIARGFQLAVHAIGDRANTLLLDVLERVGSKAGRHRIEHAQVLRPEDLPRVGALGLVASVQPTHATSDHAWVEARLGAGRLPGAYPAKTLKEGGAVLALGSDFPIESPDVLRGLYAARTRRDEAGLPREGFRPEERLTAEEALEGYTAGAAFASFAEEVRGTLRPGMQADFVMLSGDPVAAPAEALLKMRVLGTVVDGRLIYDAR